MKEPMWGIGPTTSEFSAGLNGGRRRGGIAYPGDNCTGNRIDIETGMRPHAIP
jgi:hypothetical protein